MDVCRTTSGTKTGCPMCEHGTNACCAGPHSTITVVSGFCIHSEVVFNCRQKISVSRKIAKSITDHSTKSMSSRALPNIGTINCICDCLGGTDDFRIVAMLSKAFPNDPS